MVESVELPPPDVAAEPVSVTGELWQLDEQRLAVLDEVEGVATGMFERGVVELVGVEDTAEAYFWAGECQGLADCGGSW